MWLTPVSFVFFHTNISTPFRWTLVHLQLGVPYWQHFSFYYFLWHNCWVLYVGKHHNLIPSFKTEKTEKFFFPLHSDLTLQVIIILQTIINLKSFTHLPLSISRVSTHFRQNSIFNIPYAGSEDTIWELALFMILHINLFMVSLTNFCSFFP